jgi:hypothetical protein
MNDSVPLAAALKRLASALKQRSEYLLTYSTITKQRGAYSRFAEIIYDEMRPSKLAIGPARY